MSPSRLGCPTKGQRLGVRSGGGGGGLKRSGVVPPLCSSRACLHTAFIAFSGADGGRRWPSLLSPEGQSACPTPKTRYESTSGQARRSAQRTLQTQRLRGLTFQSRQPVVNGGGGEEGDCDVCHTYAAGKGSVDQRWSLGKAVVSQREGRGGGGGGGMLKGSHAHKGRPNKHQPCDSPQ